MNSFKLRVMAQVLPFLLIAPSVVLAQTAPTRGEAAAAASLRVGGVWASTMPGAISRNGSTCAITRSFTEFIASLLALPRSIGIAMFCRGRLLS